MTNSGFLFVQKLHRSFQEAIEKGQRKHLSHEDTEKLKSALNFDLPEDKKYLDVSPHCDLTNNQETVSWMEL